MELAELTKLVTRITSMDKKYVVAVGNAFDGLTLYGPFDTHGEAFQHGENNGESDTWLVVELESPE